ncbi:MAG TPA: NosD domain-containing protein [Candidatus Thermoplasmatota archaeon]|nr:NosD domain-containing protein [Candidatus Thermoplasmatota archaeon]
MNLFTKNHFSFFLFICVCFCLLNPFSVAAHTIKETSISDVHSFEKVKINGDVSGRGCENDSLENYCYCFAIAVQDSPDQHGRSKESSVCKLVNDLLRMNISVYYSLSNFSSLVVTTASTDSFFHTFSKGTVLIPFIGNQSKDVLLSMIISDYAGNHELSKVTPIEMYMILDSITISVLPLAPARIGLYFGHYIGQMSMNAYVETMVESGFLDYQIITDETFVQKVDNSNINVLIWAGGNTGLSKIECAKTLVYEKNFDRLDSFIRQGGGYIGSCYGASVISSGIFVPFSKILSKIKLIPSVGFLSLIQSSFFPLGYSGHNTVTFEKMSHPIFFGVSNQTTTFHASSPIFSWVQNEGDVLARLTDFDVAWYNPMIPGINSELVDTYFQSCLGMPIWLSKTYGKGKIIAFGDHPELFLNTANTKILHNSVYYTTSKTKSDLFLNINYTLSFVSCLFSSTNHELYNLLRPSHKRFDDIKKMRDTIHRNCITIDRLQTKMYALSVDLFLDHKISSDTRALLENPFYDSFERWFIRFSKSCEIFEKILRSTNIESDNDIDVHHYFENLNDTLSCLLQKTNKIISLENGLVSESSLFHSILSLDTLRTRTKSQELENLLKSTYAKLTQLWPETLCLTKNIWYDFERNYAIEQLQNCSEYKNSLLLLTQKNDDYSRNIIHVNRSFVGGNGSFKAPFHSIQDALDVAKTNDTIRVYPGVYTEKLLIKTSISLEGVDRNITIIDGQKNPQHTVFVTADNVTITGFTIRNSSIKRYSCGICVYSSHNTISGNVFTQNFVGFGMGQSASFNLISNNEFYNNSYMGAAVDSPLQKNNHYVNNLFYDNPYYGLYLLNSKTHVDHNRFFNDGITISINEGPLQIYFKNNSINNRPLLCFQNKSFVTLNDDEIGSLILINCSSCKIENHQFTDTDNPVFLINCINISVTNCSFNQALNGIVTCFSKNITIADNEFKNISDTAINYRISSQGSIQNNLIKHNRVGIYFFDSSKNQIRNNDIQHNDVGVSLWSERNVYKSDQNIIQNNVFMKNNQHAYATGKNHWNKNYFDDWIGLNNRFFKTIPYFISGKLGRNIDYQPEDKEIL